MNKQLYLVVVLLLCLSGAGAWLVHNSQQDVNKTVSNTPFIDYLLSDQTLNETVNITGLQIERNNTVIMQAERVDGSWQSKHLSATKFFPVHDTELFESVRKITQAKIIEHKSAKPENHAKLGLADVNAEEGAGTLVSLQLKDKVNVSFLVGNRSSMRNGQFVRLKGSAQMLMIDQVITLPDSPYAWLQNNLLSIEQADISQIIRYQTNNQTKTVNEAQGESTQTDTSLILWKLVASTNDDSEDKLRLADIQNNESLAYEGVIDNVVASINELSFEQISELNQEQWIADDTLLKLEIMTKRGKLYTIEAKALEQDYAVRVYSSDPNQSAYLHDWQFVIPSYQIEALLKGRDDFVIVQNSNE
ncbi:MAG: DUF4340 domain-containing protein [Glaciecola sp.]